MNPQDAATVWSLLMGVVTVSATVLWWSGRKHFDAFERRLEACEGAEKIFTERIHQIAIAQAKGESIAVAVDELKEEVRGMRRDLYHVRAAMEKA